jgi:hypothetical protein
VREPDLAPVPGALLVLRSQIETETGLWQLARNGAVVLTDAEGCFAVSRPLTPLLLVDVQRDPERPGERVVQELAPADVRSGLSVLVRLPAIRGQPR